MAQEFMQVFRSLVVTGVGVLLALGRLEPGMSQSPSSPASSPGQSTQPSNTTPASSPLPPDSTPTTPTPSPSPSPTSPTTEGTPTTPTTTPVPSSPAPEFLNPNPNPLQFPTKPEEVKIQGTQPITLEQAIELARRNNRTLQESALQLERSRATLREQQAEEYPTLTLQSSVTRQQSASGEISARERAQSGGLSSLLGGSQDSVTTSFSSTLQLSYDLYTSGGRRARIRSAERQLRSDELQVEVTLEQLRLDVANDYYDLQQADESVRINEAAVRNAEVSLRDTQALERAGLGTRFDVLRAQVQLANSVQDLTNSRSQQIIARRQLAQRLSLAQSVDVVAADPVQVAGNWELPLEDTIVLAYKNRAELEQFLVQRELSQYQRRAALSALGPTVNVAAQYNVLDQFDDGISIADGYSFQAGLQWNLFEGGAARARARQSEADIAISENRFANQRNQVRFEVEQAYSNLQSNRLNIETTAAALEQAREALRLARLRFQAGVGTQTDVINAETDLTRSEGNRVQAILGYNRALAALRRAVTNLPSGILSSTDGTSGNRPDSTRRAAKAKPRSAATSAKKP